MKKRIFIASTAAVLGASFHSLHPRIVRTSVDKNEHPTLNTLQNDQKDRRIIEPALFVGCRHGIILKNPRRPIGPQPAPKISWYEKIIAIFRLN